ncbi:hypothetical protein [Paenibacillus naphthalenovorans]|uniref:hypothetical protein n=1 Tax=Paenibacillus naphthalenovorans TaxID=162209 RepID=UPI003D2E4411
MYKELRKIQQTEEDRSYDLMQEIKEILKEKKNKTVLENVVHWASNRKPRIKPAVWKNDGPSQTYDKP